MIVPCGKNIKVRGGYKDDEGIFICKREVVIDQAFLGTLFRRDYELCGMPVIFQGNTQDRPTVHF